MIIGIDGSEANEILKVGSSEYAYRLLHAIYRICIKEGTPHVFRIFIKQDKVTGLPPENSFWKYEKLPTKRLWIFREVVPKLLTGPKVDVFFSPTHYLPIFAPTCQILTIHDLGYLMFSEQFKRYDFWQLKCWTAISIFISKYIIAVSDSTKKDIVRHYPFTSEKVKRIYHGIDHSFYNSQISDNLVRQVKNKFKIRKNYILSLGTLKPSKNYEGIVSAFDKFLKNGGESADRFQLVIAGKKGWMYESIFEKVSKLGLTDKVIFTDHVSDEDKRSLFKGAFVLLSPSYWEGFGMHVLEAMSCGTPVIVSPNGSLPEVGGKAAIYVNPNDPDDIAGKLLKLVAMSKSEYNKIAKSGINRAKDFTWEKTARETLKVFEEAAK